MAQLFKYQITKNAIIIADVQMGHSGNRPKKKTVSKKEWDPDPSAEMAL
jgi:hypothetical protein